MLMDFTDLLELLVQDPERLPTLQALIIDEAQDLSKLQWTLVMQLAERAQLLLLEPLLRALGVERVQAGQGAHLLPLLDLL